MTDIGKTVARKAICSECGRVFDDGGHGLSVCASCISVDIAYGARVVTSTEPDAGAILNTWGKILPHIRRHRDTNMVEVMEEVSRLQREAGR